jgi:hypothetical protein
MNAIPAENQLWLKQFKARLTLEQSCIGLLIQWGLTECAFDLYRIIEERALLIQEHLKGDDFRFVEITPPVLSEGDKSMIRDAVRIHYTKTRDLPRSQYSRQLLQNGLLTGYETLIEQLMQFFEKYLRTCLRTPPISKAA